MIQLLLVNECLDRDQSLGADRRRVARRLILALLFTAVALLTVVAGRAEPSAARTDESQLSRSVKVSRPGERPLRSVCAKRMDAPRTLRTSGLAIPTSFAHHQLLQTEATSSWLARVHIPDRLPSAPGTLSFAERRRPSVGRWHYDPASARMTGVEFVATKPGAGLPGNATQTLETIEQTGAAPAGYKGGSTFANDGRAAGQVLPKTEPGGGSITYKEWDVNPYTKGVNRGAERLVTGSDGSVYYTNDHYTTFTKAK